MENPIPITYLNDFIYCPVSIYFHLLDSNTELLLFQESSQINGTAAHESIDNSKYSDKKTILQGIFVYCEKYNLIGKLDIFDVEKGVLTERKKTIKEIYDGFIFQLYAQYFSLVEMGYVVNEIRLYSMSDNKVYQIAMPEENQELLLKFEKTIKAISCFEFDGFVQETVAKCERCIYEPLCSYSRLKI